MLFNAGFGMDAQVVAGIDELRERGARATPDRYVGMAIRDWWDNTQQPPQISVRTSEGQNFTDLPLALVTNQSPWTYLASFPVVTNPANSPTNGLGLFSLKDLNLTTLLRVLPSLIRPPKGSPLSITNIAAEEFIALERKVLQVDDAEWIEVSSTKPVHFQIDGEYLGETTHRRLTHHPKVLRVLSEPVKPGPFRGA